MSCHIEQNHFVTDQYFLSFHVSAKYLSVDDDEPCLWKG